jgi:hypothetical protein
MAEEACWPKETSSCTIMLYKYTSFGGAITEAYTSVTSVQLADNNIVINNRRNNEANN